MKQQLEAHMKASQTLRSNISMLESKVAEAISKKETLKARALSAQVCHSLSCFPNRRLLVKWSVKDLVVV